MIKIADIEKFLAAFDNLPVFKEHPLWTDEQKDGSSFTDYRSDYWVYENTPNNKTNVVGILIDPYHNEEHLVRYAADLNAEQIALILDRRFSDLFQDGYPHVSWNTDRYRIMSKVLDAQGTVITSKCWSETWTYTTVTWYKLKTGQVIKKVVETPKNYTSGSRTRYTYTVETDFEKVPSAPTHIAMTFYSDGYDSIRIADHFSGSHDECVEWIRQNAKTNLWSLVDVETYRNNKTKN